MPRRKLPNYLRRYRRQAGLTQEELAFLIGSRHSVKVSECELFKRTPTLETALAFEAVLGVSVSELFAGVYQQIEAEVRKNAKKLAKDLYVERPDACLERKLDLLRAIVIGPQIVEENPLSPTS